MGGGMRGWHGHGQWQAVVVVRWWVDGSRSRSVGYPEVE